MNKTREEENNASKDYVTTMTGNSKMDAVFTQQAKFLTHYQEFLTYYNHYQEIVRGIEQEKAITEQFLWQLYQEAKETYCSAINSYEKAVQADQELREIVHIGGVIKGNICKYPFFVKHEQK